MVYLLILNMISWGDEIMGSIKTFKDLLKKIDDTRTYMNDMIKEKPNLLDPEIILVSQMLDSILNEYNKIINEKVDK